MNHTHNCTVDKVDSLTRPCLGQKHKFKLMNFPILVSGSGRVGLFSLLLTFVAIGKKMKVNKLLLVIECHLARLGKKGSYGKVRRLIGKKKDIGTHNAGV